MDSIVERVQLQLEVRRLPAYMISTALARWNPTPPPSRLAAEDSDSDGEVEQRPEQLSVKVKLRVASRPARPHERADGIRRGGGGLTPAPESFAHSHVTLQLADGTTVRVESELLACSTFMEPLLSRDRGVSWPERETGMLSLAEFSADAVRGVVRWLEAPVGAPKRQVAAQLLSPAHIVGVVRLCHFLDLAPPELYEAALSVLADDALDVSNAPSLLLLARQLGAAYLEQRATDYIARRLDEVETETEDWGTLPAATRSLLAALRGCVLGGMAAGAPLSQGVSRFGDARELLGMLRESCQEQRDRLREARERHHEEGCARRVAARRSDMHNPGLAIAGDLASELLLAQEARVASFGAYITHHEEVFVRLVDQHNNNTPPASTPLPPHRTSPLPPTAAMVGVEVAATGEAREAAERAAPGFEPLPSRSKDTTGYSAGGVLVPTYEWQLVRSLLSLSSVSLPPCAGGWQLASSMLRRAHQREGKG